MKRIYKCQGCGRLRDVPLHSLATSLVRLKRVPNGKLLCQFCRAEGVSVKLTAVSALHQTKAVIRAKLDARGYAIVNAVQLKRAQKMLCGNDACKQRHDVDADVTITVDGARWVAQASYPDGLTVLMPQVKP